MADEKESCVVEIPADADHRKQIIAAVESVSAIQHHPLSEISRSPGHFLLLKLWEREEHLFSRRLTGKELRKSTIKGEIFQLCCCFFLFHGLFFTILFTSSDSDSVGCKKWWIPSVVSACASAAISVLVQLKLLRFWKVDGRLQRDRAEGRAVTRCIQELRMKGASFDLDKGPQNGKRLKSSSVEIKWRPLELCSHYRVSVWLLAFAGLVVPCYRVLLCG